jgi:hypothetical protein
MAFQKYILKLFLFSIPFLILAATYVVYDPFNILRNTDFFKVQEGPSRDYISSQLYINNRNHFHYNAFIFGNSLTIGFRSTAWQPHVPGARIFHFDGAGESLHGIATKIQYIDAMGDSLKYAIVLIDSSILNPVPEEGVIYTKHPDVVHSSWVKFHTDYFISYFNKGYFIKYLDYHTFHKYRPYMSEAISNSKDSIAYPSNDLIRSTRERELLDTAMYYKVNRSHFHKRERAGTENIPLIAEYQLKLFKDMKAVFDKQHTDYKIILSPLYNQVRFNSHDKEILVRIFGADHIFDFTGINSYTADMHNYYEEKHFRPHVGAAILADIYGSANSPSSLISQKP